jgi:hypothetical protein
MYYPIIDIKTIQGPLSLSVQFEGLLPGWNLVFVCWERVTIGRHVDNKFVAVWANCLGASVMAFVTAVSTAATAAAATTAAATAVATATATATATFSFHHGHYESGVFLHYEFKLFLLGEFYV